MKIGYGKKWETLYEIHQDLRLQCWNLNQETPNQGLQDWVAERHGEGGADTLLQSTVKNKEQRAQVKGNHYPGTKKTTETPNQVLQDRNEECRCKDFNLNLNDFLSRFHYGYPHKEGRLWRLLAESS